MYQIIFQSSAERDFKKLPRDIQSRIIKKLEELKLNPHFGIPLVGNLSGLWKLRVGDYRIIYQIKNEELIILILKVGNRKNIYD